MNILIVGINPPQKSKVKNGIAFPTECRSRKTLDTWFKPIVKLAQETYGLSVTFYYANISDSYTDGNRLPDVSESDKLRLKQLASDFERVVACGRFASKVLSELSVEHFEADRPSGLNRLLNQPRRVENLKLRLRKYVIDGVIMDENSSLESSSP